LALCIYSTNLSGLFGVPERLCVVFIFPSTFKSWFSTFDFSLSSTRVQ